MENTKELKKVFCPFIRGDCKNDECMMWKEDLCLIVNYLISFQNTNESTPEEEIEYQKELEEWKKIPEELEVESVDYLADKFVSFVESTAPGNQRIWVPHHARRFWQSLGLNSTWAIPSNIQIKMGQVESKVQNLLDTKRQIKTKK